MLGLSLAIQNVMDGSSSTHSKLILTTMEREQKENLGMRLQLFGGKVYIDMVEEGSPAHMARLMRNDRIVIVNGHQVVDALSSCVYWCSNSLLYH